MDNELSRVVFLNSPGYLELLLLTILFVALLFGSYRSTNSLNSLKKKSLILTLHTLAFLLAAAIVLNPAIRTENYLNEKKTLAVLIDQSYSMSLAGDTQGATRQELLQQYLSENKNYINELKKHYNINYFSFDSTVAPLTEGIDLSNPPLGKKTDIAKSIRSITEQRNIKGVDAVLLFSDGGTQGTSATSELNKGSKVNIPIHTIYTATENHMADLWIDKIQASEISYLRYPFKVKAVIKSDGIDSSAIPVTLYEGDKIISIRQANLDPLTSKGEVEFVLNPKSLGKKVYTVSIPNLSSELIKENNQRSFATDVIINKIRILHVAGSPSWDVRFFRKLLKRNPNVDLISFFILRDASDIVYASENELSLIPFPVNDIFGTELSTFDIVIFQNFQYQPYGIFGFHLKNIRDFVVNDGGAFLMIGGDKSFESGNYGNTPLADILPLDMDYIPRTLEETIVKDSIDIMLTELGKSHPVTQLSTDAGENVGLWEQMPDLESHNLVRGPKPTAQELLQSLAGDTVLAIGKAKSGKTASFLSDSSWKWSFERNQKHNSSPHYVKFWSRLLRWLVNDPDLKNIRVKTNNNHYNSGDVASFDIWTLDKRRAREDITTELTLPDGTKSTLEIESDLKKGFSTDLTLTEYGTYKLSASTPESFTQGDDSNVYETLFFVGPPTAELKGTSLNSKNLADIAKLSGGSSISIKTPLEAINIDRSPKKSITGYSTKKLWVTPILLGIIIALLSADWFLRRRWGLR